MKKTSIFYKAFINEYVEIATKLDTPHASTTAEGEAVAYPIPLIVNGVIVDIDAHYVYLGDDNGILAAIKHDDIGLIRICERPSEQAADELLN